MWAARTRSSPLNAIPARLSMLRRAFNSLTLYGCLLLAGIPVVACADAMPMQECCPSAPGAPCRGNTPDAPQGITSALACCASGMQSSTAVTGVVASPKIACQTHPVDPPVAINAYASLTISDARTRTKVPLSVVSRLPSNSTLYLSTGRLRL